MDGGTAWPTTGANTCWRAVQAQEKPRQDALEFVRANRARKRISASKKSLPKSVVGECVMVAGAQKRDELPKLASMWTRLWRVVSAGGQHVYGTEDIATGQLKDAHVARMSPRAGNSPAVTNELK